jgi:hypothetical protein
MDTLDTAEIKSKTDLRDVASRLVELRSEKANGSEMSGPCPKCGGTDRFHCTADWWFCRVCHEKRADVIDFVQFAGLASDFRSAIDYLNGPVQFSRPSRENWKTERKQPERKAGSSTWQTPTWQNDARQFLDTAALRLGLPEGLPGREYLAKRGIMPATWEAYGLGYADAWHPRRQKRLPALILPWQKGDQIKALQYRFIGDDITHGERFGQKAGGERTLFGVDLLASRPALILVEGELNAVSIWQVASDLVDVVSFGPEDNIDRATPYMKALASGFLRVIVWADKPERALHAQTAIGRESTPVQSPNGRDANDLLRDGLLRAVVAVWSAGFATWQELESASGLAYVRWCENRTDENLAEYHHLDDLWAAAMGLERA